jgi:uncharacterized protein YndB with AHSA1/START domain
MKVKIAALAVALAAPGAAWGQAASAVVDSSFSEPDGDRVLQLSATIPAPPEAVWRAITTAEGWKRLGVRMASVDFRIGGVIETSYRADAHPGQAGNIRNEIVAYVPDRMLVIRNVQAPPGFPHAQEFSQTVTVFELQPAEGNTTVLRVSGVGFRPSPAFDALYGMFAAGNAATLDLLRRSFAAPAAAR